MLKFEKVDSLNRARVKCSRIDSLLTEGELREIATEALRAADELKSDRTIILYPNGYLEFTVRADASVSIKFNKKDYELGRNDSFKVIRLLKSLVNKDVEILEKALEVLERTETFGTLSFKQSIGLALQGVYSVDLQFRLSINMSEDRKIMQVSGPDEVFNVNVDSEAMDNLRYLAHNAGGVK